MSLLDIEYRIFSFFELGGFAISIIGLALLLLWIVIVERYLYLYFTYPKLKQHLIGEWRARPNKQGWASQRVRDLLISRAQLALHSNLHLLRALVILAPMLGLFGTVTGMIQVFDTLAMLGTGNARAMAEGISKATVPTMAGMIVALPGLYFHSQLSSRVRLERRKLAETLSDQ